MQTEQTAVLAPTGNHTWSITIDGVTDEAFRVFWHGEGRTEFRRTEGGDVEHVVVSGLQDDFQKTEAALEAPVLSLSHPEMWQKAAPEDISASPAPDEALNAPAGSATPATLAITETAVPDLSTSRRRRSTGGDSDAQATETATDTLEG
ncbi:hypothetical protein TSA6c_16940 [Azospirillum sp. TSA6c]|uniref:hypothetical protein n=1 Tax=Azospirillum sp. TSA6c TaxID=709813 RepID=UPI000D614926|nr:hypothetical protein [Azospirillum sp. TSA6c]PWC48123.1 hypothetical protein TSA6c_16940 [Azospirillum sp. TSA6c]